MGFVARGTAGRREVYFALGSRVERRNGRKRIVALGVVVLGNLTHKVSVENLSVNDAIWVSRLLRLTIHAKGMDHAGIFSLQKPRTRVRAVISKGIKRAS